MITRVLDENNIVLHDCIVERCAISWDGVAMRDLTPADLHADEATRPASLANIRKGTRVPAAEDPNPSVYDVKGNTAKLRAGH